MADICHSIIDSVLVFLLTVFLTGGISMTMSLVKKKNPRGALIRELTDEEESAVHDFFGRVRPEKRHIAESVILTMRQKDAWLQCS
nr:hypothetical protein [Pantoea ananatis]